MSKRDIRAFLLDILDSMNAIDDYVKNTTFDEFLNNRMMRQAVIRELEIIGEATKNIPEKIRKKYPEIPWKGMAGVRDKVIHGYFGVDYDIIWKLIKVRIPQTKPLIEDVLKDLEENNEEQ
ncbi:MAG: hypothetical protein PWP15_217 [Methanothermococcus sp.]|jgi:uncharacterized protein with HEPN domain|uniref:HepT-like ribonuclease domain-containing protein n=1 Tax=Methanothermococcus sp. TaxID=2614238 RepID=UPI00258BEA3C|nr:DUF86 domain-containing protein [Methanothermococcus sp.]MDK2789710.1 hypothetical protein [Methanothermococcus sp.]